MKPISTYFQPFKTRNGQKKYTEIKTALIKYCKHITIPIRNGTGITIVGSVGTGKTYVIKLLYQWLKDFCEHYNKNLPEYRIDDDGIKRYFQKHYYTIYPKMLNNMDIIRKFSDNEYIDKLATYKFLIIDDFGIGIPDEKEFEYNKVVRQFYYLINRRYEKKLTTIITTNYLYKDSENYDFYDAFGKQYAPMIIRRIQERNLSFELRDIPYHQWITKKTG